MVFIFQCYGVQIDKNSSTSSTTYSLFTQLLNVITEYVCSSVRRFHSTVTEISFITTRDDARIPMKHRIIK